MTGKNIGDTGVVALSEMLQWTDTFTEMNLESDDESEEKEKEKEIRMKDRE